jgi:Kdo2-lipid IVA lauroyltransferase/acyltransferase
MPIAREGTSRHSCPTRTSDAVSAPSPPGTDPALKAPPRRKRRKPTAFEKRLQHWALAGATATLGRISPRGRMRLAAAIGRIAATFFPFRRTLVLDNLRRAFPEWTEADRRALLPGIYAQLLALGLDGLGMEHLTREELRDGVEIDDRTRQLIEEFRNSGRGFVVMTAHFGNWEWMGAFMLALGFEVGTLAKPLRNETVQAFIAAQRERMGYSVFYTDQSPLRLFRHVRKGGIIALLADQDARRNGTFIPFFDYPASTPTGPAWVAVKLGVPILPGFGFRTASGSIRAWAGEPFYPDPEADENEEIERALRHYHAQLEMVIRQEPTQYMWFHRRWKTRPKVGDVPDPARVHESVG